MAMVEIGADVIAEPDDVLVERLVGGEKDALAELYARHSSLLLGIGIKMLRNRQEAEDLVHDVFMESWSKAASFDPSRGSVCGWLVLRMRSRVIDRIRSARHRRERLSSRPNDEEGAEIAVAPNEAPTPWLKGEQSHFQDALLALSDESLRVVDLVYFRAHTIGEAAKVLNVPAGTVKSRLFKARGLLRSSMSKGGPS